MFRFIALAALVGACLAPSATPAAGAHKAEIGLFLIDIMDLDQMAGTFTAEFDVVARWQDPAAGFDPAEEGEDLRVYTGKRAEALLDEVWDPGVFAVNVVGSREMGQLTVTEAPDGILTLRLRMVRTVRAALDFRRFPFDRQVLPVHVESFLYDEDELVILPLEDFSGFDASFDMPEWEVVGLTTARASHPRRQEMGRPYDRLSFLVHMKRLIGYYIWKIMLPMAIIVMVSWVVFWMSGEMLGRRAGVSSTGMLTVIAYQFVIAGSLPRFPYLTVMDHFALFSLVLIAATMGVNMVVSRLDAERCLRVDRACRVLFPAVYVLGLAVLLSGIRGA